MQRNDIKAVRNSNLELYRIIVMLLIVAHHYVVNSGVIEIASEYPTSLRSLYYYLFGAWGKVGINCFVLITGYFMCEREISFRKFIKLLLEVVFYMVVINAILIIAGIEQLSIKELYSDIQLLFDVSYGFTSCFILFYLFIPFLNILVHNMTQQQHKLLVFLCLSIYTGISTLKVGEVNMNYIVWFSIIYFISSYIRLYNPFPKTQWGLITGIILSLSIVSILASCFVNEHLGRQNLPWHFVSDANSLFAVMLSISSFMYFKNLNISQSKWTNIIAQSCFGVLLIHANSNAMHRWLWGDLLHVSNQYYTDSFIFHSLISVIAIYIVCTFIDQLRICCIERPLFGYFERKKRFRMHY